MNRNTRYFITEIIFFFKKLDLQIFFQTAYMIIIHEPKKTDASNKIAFGLLYYGISQASHFKVNKIKKKIQYYQLI